MRSRSSKSKKEIKQGKGMRDGNIREGVGENFLDLSLKKERGASSVNGHIGPASHVY